MWVLIAQDVGTLTGWSSFGVAGAVLGWLLLVYLPRKDKETREVAKEAADRIDALIKAHLEHARTERADFRTALQTVVTHCEQQAELAARQAAEISTAVNRLTEALRREPPR